MDDNIFKMTSSKPTKVGGFQRLSDLVPCGLCEKPVDVNEGWHWDEEPCHKSCVLKKAKWYCTGKEVHFQEVIDGDRMYCEECGATMLRLTGQVRRLYRIPRKAKALRILRVKL